MNVELPIIYRKTRAWMTAFPCSTEAAKALLPDPALRPIEIWPGTSALGVAVYDYVDTSVGPYGEVGLAIPCRYRRSTAVPLLPLLAERWLDDVGHWVELLPVTTEIANYGGRTFWGYPKFVAEITIDATDQKMRCLVAEHGDKILEVEVQRPGPSRPLRFPLRTYSRLEDELLLTELEIDAVGFWKRLGARAKLTLHDHPRVRHLQKLDIRCDRAIEVRWLDELRTSLDRARARYRIGT
jgi:hypothetical protein